MNQSPIALADALGHEVADKRLDILRRIGQVGSISEAARGAGVSYKAAWQALDALTNLAGAPLVERTVGGSGGGGARLTATGSQLLQIADTLHALRAQAFAQLALPSTNPTAPAPRLAALGLRTSMRNQLPCQVVRLTRSGQATRVHLLLADGCSLVSRITRESAELLGLAANARVLALAKATAVVMTAEDTALANAPKTCNRLVGVVNRITRASAGDEVVLTLPSGLNMVGFATPGLRLAKGQSATAMVEESAVVLAVGG
ncbi:MAG: TOBE domain-containing protein [Rhodoferax sp.]|nr:TOBE domain-containing protein [Rhodoferax sp.]